jgi:two-component system, NtrC family, response regulator PilR
MTNAPASNPAAYRLLVIDDEPDLRTLYELSLLREGYQVDTAENVQDALAALAADSFDLVITDMRLPDGSGMDVLQAIESQNRKERVMVITAFSSAESAVEALRAGAYDYLTKPVDLQQFRLAVRAALQAESESNKASTSPPVRKTPAQRPAALDHLIGESPPIQEIRQLIQKVARSMAPVRLWGESGTGKELVARAIHDSGSRAHGPFIAVNCGAIPDHLLEAEFFGYRKGAFTGAQEDRQGFFQAAQGGTLFLDEIGDLPLAMQAKLLRVIQERAVRPLGAVQEVACDVRLISASHKDLSEEVRAGQFRQDLFYRLNVILITLPPLRERLSDLPLIAQQLLERIANESGLAQIPNLDQTALQTLMQHRFDGNVRELENILHRAVALSEGGQIKTEDLGISVGSNTTTNTSPAPSIDSTNSADWADTVSEAAATSAPDTLPTDLAAYLDTMERSILTKALVKHQFNRTAAGASLGLSLRQIRYRMARLGLHIVNQSLVSGPPEALPMADADEQDDPC